MAEQESKRLTDYQLGCVFTRIRQGPRSGDAREVVKGHVAALEAEIAELNAMLDTNMRVVTAIDADEDRKDKRIAELKAGLREMGTVQAQRWTAHERYRFIDALLTPGEGDSDANDAV